MKEKICKYCNDWLEITHYNGYCQNKKVQEEFNRKIIEQYYNSGCRHWNEKKVK